MQTEELLRTNDTSSDSPYDQVEIPANKWILIGEGPMDIRTEDPVFYSDRIPAPEGEKAELPQKRWVRINSGKIYVRSENGRATIDRRPVER